MQKYEFLEHTADAKFRAYGKTLEEAFINAALATTTIMCEVSEVKPKIEKKLNITAKKKESLLFDFLQQLVILLDTEGFLLGAVKSITISKNKEVYSLHAVILGDSADHYEIHTAIKAVTYNDMFIKEEQGLITIQVVHDL